MCVGGGGYSKLIFFKESKSERKKFPFSFEGGGGKGGLGGGGGLVGGEQLE